ncbi:PAS domain-containing protein [Thiomicrospira pelophila]|uniref:PAS domain-containing protein n=1 Tax=Thiomicrospira pelophila TaxID=934 RepID=UPI0004A70DA8|nr:PAS domain-containing protein [Thiomicrospira pelophila]
MFFPKLLQVATRDVVTIDDNQTIQDAVHLMHEHNIRDVVVNGKTGLRILTTRELIEFQVLGVAFSTPLNQVELNNVPQMSPDASVIDGLAALKDHPDEHLCLINEHGLCGIVSYSDLASCLDPQHLAQTRSIGELVRMVRVIRVSPKDTLESAFLEMNRVKQAAAIVVDERAHPIGIITQSDIINLLDHEWQAGKPVEEAMTSPLITFDESMTLQEALSMSRKNRIKRLVVVDESDRISGIVHQKDLVALVYQDWSDLLHQQKRQLKTERDLFAGGPVSVIVWRAEPGWPVEFVSDNIRNLIGYSANELTDPNFRFADIVHPEDLAQVSKEVSQFTSEHRIGWEQHYRVLDSEGQTHWLYDYTRAEYDDNGHFLKSYGYLLDQTESVNIRKSLEQTEERLESIISQSKQIIWEIDINGLYTFISPAVTQVLGYEPQELINKVHYYELHPEVSREKFKKDTFKLLVRGASVNDLENQVTAKNGELFWFSTSGQPLFNSKHQVVGYRGVYIDVTDRKMVEQEIANSEKRWRSVLDGTDQGVWDWDAQTNRVYFSDKWKSMLGYESNEISDSLDEWSSRVHPEDMPSVESDLQAHFRGETDFYENVHRVQTKASGYKWILDRGRVLERDEAGQPLRVVGTHTDVSNQREQKERLNGIAENVPGMIYQFVIHSDGRMAFPYTSQGIEGIYGVKPSDVKKDASVVLNLIHPDDIKQVTDSMMFSAENLSVWRCEYRVILPKGEIWVSGQATPVRQEDGAVLWHGYIHDVTEQKKTEQALYSNQARLNKAQQVAKMGSWELDLISGRLEWSDEVFRIFELAPQSFVPSYEKFMQMIHPDDRDIVEKSYQKSIQDKSPYDIDHRLQMPDGRVKWVREMAENEFNQQGELIKSHGTVQDITEQVEIKQKLQASESQYQDLVESHPYMINRFFPDTTMTFVNTAMAEYFGFSVEKLIGQQWINMLSENDRLSNLRALECCSAENPTIAFVNEVKRFDGQLRSVKWVNRAFFDQQGRLSHFQSVGVDITDQLQAEAAIKQAQKTAELANQAKSEFLANMSHEIRTPMNAILGLSELALQGELPSKARSQMSKIFQSGRSLLGIINDILDFSKIESGRLTIENQGFYFDVLLDHLASLFSDEAARKQLKLVWQIEPDLAKIYRGDELRLRQTLTNLIGNAIKFTDQGEVRLVVKHQIPDNTNNHQAWLRFEVHDTGLGISEHNQQKLFQPFSQADTTITRQYGGTGLGLVISQRLVKAMGGAGIEVSSQLGQGSCFCFSLPLGLCDEQDLKELKDRDHRLSMSQQSLTGDVLLVEDNPINQEIAQEMLMQMGLNVQTVSDGAEAVNQAKHQTFDAILMDIQMPVMDGYQATRAIREFNADVPIIALTAAAMVEDKHKALAAGMNAHLGKPIESIQLYHVLSQWLKDVPSLIQTENIIDDQYENLPSLSGFDLQKGLTQLQGNQTLFERLLNKFSAQLNGQFKPLPDLLKQLTKSDEESVWVEAQTLSHALKGVSGNLGAFHLADLTSHIDQLLKQRQSVSVRTIKALETAMRDARMQIEASFPQQTVKQIDDSDKVALNADELNLKVNQLKEVINNSEYIDLLQLESLFDGLPYAAQAHKADLVSAIELFDYEQAAQLISQLIDSLKLNATTE